MVTHSGALPDSGAVLVSPLAARNFASLRARLLRRHRRRHPDLRLWLNLYAGRSLNLRRWGALFLADLATFDSSRFPGSMPLLAPIHD